MSNARGKKQEKPEPPKAELVAFSDIRPEKPKWLWDRRLPQGKLAILEGDPGEGKSMITVDWAARVSTGRPMPLESGKRAPAGVVILSAEDNPNDTIHPRLIAAGADMSRVFWFRDVKALTGERDVRIPEDVELIVNAIKEAKAKLVVIDPLMAFLRGVTATQDQSVRQALMQLRMVAEKSGACIVLIRHLIKTGSSRGIYRGSGSIGVVGAAIPLRLPESPLARAGSR